MIREICQITISTVGELNITWFRNTAFEALVSPFEVLHTALLKWNTTDCYQDLKQRAATCVHKAKTVLAFPVCMSHKHIMHLIAEPVLISTRFGVTVVHRHSLSQNQQHSLKEKEREGRGVDREWLSAITRPQMSEKGFISQEMTEWELSG